MQANQDFKDLFVLFNQEAVEYLVVGAHAVIYYSEPRFTKDLDIWIRPTRENAVRVLSALSIFGAPLGNINVNDFTNPENVFQIGVAPNRIDILMGVGGVDFEAAYSRKVSSTYDNIPIWIIGRQDLIAAKKAVDRPQDRIDIEKLTQRIPPE